MASTISYSTYQQNFLDAISQRDKNVVLNAAAGAGKTFTILESLKKFDPRLSVIIVCFNVDISKEIQEKADKMCLKLSQQDGIPRNVKVMTVNSLGFGIYRHNRDVEIRRISDKNPSKSVSCLKKQIEVNNKNKKYVTSYKVSNTIQNLEKKEGWFNEVNPTLRLPSKVTPSEFKRQLRKIITFGRANLKIRQNDLIQIAQEYGMIITPQVFPIAEKVLRLLFNDVTQIDFDEQIFNTLAGLRRPVNNKYRFTVPPRYQADIVMIDESQDLTLAKQELALSCVKPGGIFVAVGDRRQAIYLFSGASLKGMDTFSYKPNTVELPLSTCYRCAKSIIREAQKHNPNIEEWADAPEGEVIHLEQNTDLSEILVPGDAVVCRNNKHLVSLCLKLLSKGVAANLLGRDIGMKLCKDIDATKAKRSNKLFRVLREQANSVFEMLVDNGISREDAESHDMYTNITSKIEVFKTLYDNGFDTPEKMKNEIKRMYVKSSDKDAIVLSTIHKSKGGEWDRVVFLGPELLPSKACKTPEEFLTESNLSYIAITRAKKTLFYMPVKEEKEE